MDEENQNFSSNDIMLGARFIKGHHMLVDLEYFSIDEYKAEWQFQRLHQCLKDLWQMFQNNNHHVELPKLLLWLLAPETRKNWPTGKSETREKEHTCRLSKSALFPIKMKGRGSPSLSVEPDCLRKLLWCSSRLLKVRISVTSKQRK